MKILAGAIPRDAGGIFLDGTEVRLDSRRPRSGSASA